ncbi:hypothetical protein AAMO2058_001576600 [Amorphochlora amoebiformis]
MPDRSGAGESERSKGTDAKTAKSGPKKGKGARGKKLDMFERQRQKMGLGSSAGPGDSSASAPAQKKSSKKKQAFLSKLQAAQKASTTPSEENSNSLPAHKRKVSTTFKKNLAFLKAQQDAPASSTEGKGALPKRKRRISTTFKKKQAFLNQESKEKLAPSVKSPPGKLKNKFKNLGGVSITSPKTDGSVASPQKRPGKLNSKFKDFKKAISTGSPSEGKKSSSPSVPATSKPSAPGKLKNKFKNIGKGIPLSNSSEPIKRNPGKLKKKFKNLVAAKDDAPSSKPSAKPSDKKKIDTKQFEKQAVSSPPSDAPNKPPTPGKLKNKFKNIGIQTGSPTEAPKRTPGKLKNKFKRLSLSVGITMTPPKESRSEKKIDLSKFENDGVSPPSSYDSPNKPPTPGKLKKFKPLAQKDGAGPTKPPSPGARRGKLKNRGPAGLAGLLGRSGVSSGATHRRTRSAAAGSPEFYGGGAAKEESAGVSRGTRVRTARKAPAGLAGIIGGMGPASGTASSGTPKQSETETSEGEVKRPDQKLEHRNRSRPRVARRSPSRKFRTKQLEKVLGSTSGLKFSPPSSPRSSRPARGTRKARGVRQARAESDMLSIRETGEQDLTHHRRPKSRAKGKRRRKKGRGFKSTPVAGTLLRGYYENMMKKMARVYDAARQIDELMEIINNPKPSPPTPLKDPEAKDSVDGDSKPEGKDGKAHPVDQQKAKEGSGPTEVESKKNPEENPKEVDKQKTKEEDKEETKEETKDTETLSGEKPDNDGENKPNPTPSKEGADPNPTPEAKPSTEGADEKTEGKRELNEKEGVGEPAESKKGGSVKGASEKEKKGVPKAKAESKVDTSGSLKDKSAAIKDPKASRGDISPNPMSRDDRPTWQEEHLPDTGNKAPATPPRPKNIDWTADHLPTADEPPPTPPRPKEPPKPRLPSRESSTRALRRESTSAKPPTPARRSSAITAVVPSVSSGRARSGTMPAKLDSQAVSVAVSGKRPAKPATSKVVRPRPAGPKPSKKDVDVKGGQEARPPRPKTSSKPKPSDSNPNPKTKEKRLGGGRKMGGLMAGLEAALKKRGGPDSPSSKPKKFPQDGKPPSLPEDRKTKKPKHKVSASKDVKDLVLRHASEISAAKKRLSLIEENETKLQQDIENEKTSLGTPRASGGDQGSEPNTPQEKLSIEKDHSKKPEDDAEGKLGSMEGVAKCEMRFDMKMGRQYQLTAMTGDNLIKHGRSGKPHVKFIVATATGRIYWLDKKNRITTKTKSFLSLKDITEIQLGKKTKVLKRSTARKAPEKCCFSLITKARNLDLQADNPDEAKLWIGAILYLQYVEANK